MRGERVVSSRAERYRELARECLKLANLIPRGPQRDRAIEMAHEWVRLADEQDGAATPVAAALSAARLLTERVADGRRVAPPLAIARDLPAVVRKTVSGSARTTPISTSKITPIDTTTITQSAGTPNVGN
jgi:hypothetical protein